MKTLTAWHWWCPQDWRHARDISKSTAGYAELFQHLEFSGTLHPLRDDLTANVTGE